MTQAFSLVQGAMAAVGEVIHNHLWSSGFRHGAAVRSRRRTDL